MKTMICKSCNKEFLVRGKRQAKYCSKECRGTGNDRLLSKVNKTRKCWLWTGKTLSGGRYGRIMIFGKREAAHRVMYFWHNPEADKKLCVLHKCDTPLCVNPKHLFLGTMKDNCADRDKKGRGVMPRRDGEFSSFSKLKWKDVISIRKLYKEGNSRTELANKFNITNANVRLIVLEKSWKEIK